VRVVPGGDQQLPGGVHPDARQGEQPRRNGGDQRGELGVQVVNLGLQRLPAVGQGPQRYLGRRCRAVSGKIGSNREDGEGSGSALFSAGSNIARSATALAA
jgi:hypothetical protein